LPQPDTAKPVTGVWGAVVAGFGVEGFGVVLGVGVGVAFLVGDGFGGVLVGVLVGLGGREVTVTVVGTALDVVVAVPVGSSSGLIARWSRSDEVVALVDDAATGTPPPPGIVTHPASALRARPVDATATT
jgi:hypothetical protein